MAQAPIHGIQNIGRHHGYLVNDQGVEVCQDGERLSRDETQLSVSNNPNRQAQEGVNRLAAHGERGDACGGTHRHHFCRTRHKSLKKGGLACARTSRNEHVVLGVLHLVKDGALFITQDNVTHHWLLIT